MYLQFLKGGLRLTVSNHLRMSGHSHHSVTILIFVLPPFRRYGEYVLTYFGRDVAIIFYGHLLSQFSFHGDIESHFPSLWKAEIEFSLVRRRSTNRVEASKRVWMESPDLTYQIVEFTLAGDLVYITENAIDIYGYKCRPLDCAGKGAYVIRMTE